MTPYSRATASTPRANSRATSGSQRSSTTHFAPTNSRTTTFPFSRVTSDDLKPTESTRSPQFSLRNSVSLLATKDGAEPLIGTSSDAGAVPAASTMSAWHKADASHADGPKTSDGRVLLMGAKQDRRRSDDRSCTRHDTAVIGSNHNCERQSVRCGNAPRGVVEAAPAGRVATEARHLFIRIASLFPFRAHARGKRRCRYAMNPAIGSGALFLHDPEPGGNLPGA